MCRTGCARATAPTPRPCCACKTRGVRVVVTVDCGTTAHLPLAEAAEAGLDVIVIDHHVAEPLLPRAAAIVNPNRLDETSPHGPLAAVGVAFLLVVAVNRALRQAGWYTGGRASPTSCSGSTWWRSARCATWCRSPGSTGPWSPRASRSPARLANPGLAALAAVAGLDEPLDAYHLGFLLGPRVNAGGRVGAADLGARLLATDDPALAAELAGRLDQYNRERREIEARTLDAAIAMVEAAPQSPVLIFAAAEVGIPG